MLAAMAMTEGPHLDRLLEALAAEARAHRALLNPAADPGEAAAALGEAAALYRASWELAPPASYGRLIGLLKAAVIAGGGQAEAEYARTQVPDDAASPPAAYVRAIVALILGEDDAAVAAADGMRAGSPAFGRAADAITALADGDRAGYEAAVAAIVTDFTAREEHLTGVRIADTALMLERLAEPRGLAAHPDSALLPAG
jgi:hypothetical protein